MRAQGQRGMKAVLLAGGRGTRFTEETNLKPKLMIEIGGKPILQHITKIYSANGINDFIICLGRNCLLHASDVTVDLRKSDITLHRANAEPWSITVVDSGEDTMIGGPIKHILPYVKDEPAFCVSAEGTDAVGAGPGGGAKGGRGVCVRVAAGSSRDRTWD
jgi:glucose-1-phosphate cytidylyltransferase